MYLRRMFVDVYVCIVLLQWASVASWFMRPEGRPLHPDNIIPPTVCTVSTQIQYLCVLIIYYTSYYDQYILLLYRRQKAKSHKGLLWFFATEVILTFFLDIYLFIYTTTIQCFK